MKNLILGLALIGCAVACKSETSSVSDASKANMPKAECCEGKTECSDKMKAECAGKTGAECQKACPVTGKPQG